MERRHGLFSLSGPLEDSGAWAKWPGDGAHLAWTVVEPEALGATHWSLTGLADGSPEASDMSCVTWT